VTPPCSHASCCACAEVGQRNAAAAAGGTRAAGGPARGSMRLTFARELYHDVCDRLTRDLGAPHLIFGPNAGASPSRA
jgi:hypothetical protein